MEITTIVKTLIEKGGEILDITSNCIEIEMWNNLKIYVDNKNEILDVRQEKIELQYPFSLLNDKTLNKILEFMED